MKKLLLIIFSVALSCANAQERHYSYKTLPFADNVYESVTSDLQGNLYLTFDTHLDFFTPDGRRHLNYSDQTWGNITHVDAGIASKILVFYRESGNIVLLNNELAPISSPLNLFDRSLMTVSLAAMGNPKKIVLYDEANQDLLITDLSLNVLTRTHITFPGEFHPSDMQVIPDHRIALLDTLHGICLFDFFGTFEKEIPTPDIKIMQLEKDGVVYYQNSQIFHYRMPSPTTPLREPAVIFAWPNIKDFDVNAGGLYYIDNQGHIFCLSEK